MRIPIFSIGRPAGCSRPPPPPFARLAHIGSVCAGLLGLFLGREPASAADFTVTYPGGSAYAINTIGGNPTQTLVRGELYTFFVNNTSSSHPFDIVSPAGTTTNDNISSGTISFRVPTNAANYTYRCSVHGFGGQILTIPPPTVRIVKLNVSTNIVLRSTGTNWSVVPEFKTNLFSSNWVAMTVQTNRFITGTNETICGRPPASNIFIRVKALRN